MKKVGFTLAEILVTLGIIGVVSAITLPTLMSNTTDAQIGPKLAKAVSAFEQANEALLNAESVDSLTDARLLVENNASTYINRLANHMKINSTGNNTFTSKDGIGYDIFINNIVPNNPQAPAYQQPIGTATIDINGANEPNTPGTDRFNFSFWNDGSLRPAGGANWDGLNNQLGSWQRDCPIGEVPREDYSMCAGHIFENNLKVLYK